MKGTQGFQRGDQRAGTETRRRRGVDRSISKREEAPLKNNKFQIQLQRTVKKLKREVEKSSKKVSYSRSGGKKSF